MLYPPPVFLFLFDYCGQAETPLLEAAEKGDAEETQRLVNANTNPNEPRSVSDARSRFALDVNFSETVLRQTFHR